MPSLTRAMRGVAQILLALWLGWCAPSRAAESEDIEQLIQQGNYQTALQAIEAALAKHGRVEQLLLPKGFVHIQLKQLDAAEQLYLELSKSMPDNPAVLNNLGVVYQLQNRLPEAIAQFQAVLKRFPQFTRAYENLGATYLRLATQTYQRGAEKLPGDKGLGEKSKLSADFHRQVDKKTAHLGAQPGGKAASPPTNTPAAAQRPARPADAKLQQQLAEFLESWVASWSSRNTRTYLSHYSADFVPSEAMPLKNWLRARKNRLQQAQYIKVVLQDVKFKQTGPQLVTVSFTQVYESDTEKTELTKQLGLKRYGNRWLIVAER